MKERLDNHFKGEEQQEIQRSYHSQHRIEYAEQKTESEEKERFIDPPLQLPKRAYSLQPDMANGWKPKKSNKINVNNVFSINYQQLVVDEIVRQLYKTKRKGKEFLVYLGPRRNNSYILHENHSYQNPYPVDKKLEQLFSARNGVPLAPKVQDSYLTFNADFQGGNLDVAIQSDSNQFDLFMRVDTNTRGHTNWYNFTIQNHQFVGTVRFNICNFRREKSLYQRGLKPYTFSKLQDAEWRQEGKNVTYQKKKLRYEFLYQQGEDEIQYMQKIFLTK